MVEVDAIAEHPRDEVDVARLLADVADRHDLGTRLDALRLEQPSERPPVFEQVRAVPD